MIDGFNNEAEGYAASLRQQAKWSDDCDEPPTVDSDELRAAADFIDRQQAKLDSLRRDPVEKPDWAATAPINYDAEYLHGCYQHLNFGPYLS